MAGRGVDLKDEAEVSEYLKNLGIEYRFGCYHEKNPKSCHLLADYMEAVKRDFHRALRIYETNCTEFRHGQSCHKAGGYRAEGKACDKDMDASYDLFRTGCELGYFRACFNAGLIESDSSGSLGVRAKSAPDAKKAAFFYKKACEQGGVDEACYRYASLFYTGVRDVLEVNFGHFY